MNCVGARILIENGADARNRALSDHIAACDACRRYDAVGLLLREVVRAEPAPSPPADFAAGVMSAWNEEQTAVAAWKLFARGTWDLIEGELVRAWWTTTGALAMARDSVAYAMMTTLAASRAMARNR